MSPRLFLLCARGECGRRRRVRAGDRGVLARPGYCSHRCAALQQRLGVDRAAAAKRRMLARVAHLSPLEAFRLGYVRGLQSKLRQIRTRYALVRKETTRVTVPSSLAP